MNRQINKLLTRPLFCALLCLPALGSADFRFDQARKYANADKGSPGMSSDQQQEMGNRPHNPTNPNMNRGQDPTQGYPNPTGQNNYSRMNWNYPQTYSRADQYQMNYNDDFKNRPNSFFGSNQDKPVDSDEYRNRPDPRNQNQNPNIGGQRWYGQGGDQYNNRMSNQQNWYTRDRDQYNTDNQQRWHSSGRDQYNNSMSEPSQRHFASDQTRYFPGNSYYSSGADMNGDGVVSPSERQHYRSSLYSSYNRSPSYSNYSYGYSPYDSYSGNQMYSSSYSEPSYSSYSYGYSPYDSYSGNQMYGSSYVDPSYSNYTYEDTPNDYFSGDQSYDSGLYPYSQYYNEDRGEAMNGGYYFNFR